VSHPIKDDGGLVASGQTRREEMDIINNDLRSH
jgi:hypothetical protein